MHAPIPLRKIEPLDAPLEDARAEIRVQFVAVITRDGKIGQISLLRAANPALRQAVIQDLASWNFKPATRDGVAVDVDAVIEIPFSLPSELARQTAPEKTVSPQR